MKKIKLLTLGLLICFVTFSQDSLLYIGNQVDSVKYKICTERGHVSGGLVLSTLMYCEPYMEENDTISYLVYPACNYNSFICKRCGVYITQREREHRIVIWRKEK